MQTIDEVKKQIARCERQIDIAIWGGFLASAVVAAILFWGCDLRGRLLYVLSCPVVGWGIYSVLGGPAAAKRKSALEKELKAKTIKR